MEPSTGSYRSAGVDIEAAEAAKIEIATRVAATHNVSVLRDVGHFGGFFRAPRSDGDVVLVSSADSVGTKVLLAARSGNHYSIGADLVNHCVNDILACGALPLFFLDYYATPQLDLNALKDVIEGMSDACRSANCAIVGGETAQLPGIYQTGTYDLAGFIVGAVDESRIVDGSQIQLDDVIIGLPSTGLHTNGYTLARSVLGFTADLERPSDPRCADSSNDSNSALLDSLLAPHRSYLPVVAPLLELDLLKGMAHITGGGIAGNVGRIIPDGLIAEIDRTTWVPNPIFSVIQQRGAIPDAEMFKVFNMGIGFVLIVRPADVERVLNVVPDGFAAGRVVAGSDEPNVRICHRDDGRAAS